MPHRGQKRDERPRQAARRLDKGNRTDREDSTGRADSNRAVMSTPPERKSPRDERRAALLEGMGVPAPWRRLGDVLAEAVDPVLRAILEAGRNVNAEPGDGAAAILPDGEAVLLFATPDGLTVRRHATDAELRVFLSRAREAA